MMRPRKRNVGPTLLAVVGILVMLTGMAFHYWRPDLYPIEWSVQLIGASLAFAGFYAMDSTRAKDGGNFLVDAGTKIIGVIRTGQRATDPVVTVTKSVEPAVPLVPPIEEPPPAQGLDR